MRVVIVDNFDSFTQNLAQAIGGLGAQAIVVRNSALVSEVAGLCPDRLVLSPGPGTPDRTGSSAAIVREFAGRVPILGVCLGMQLLATLRGARIVRAGRPVHGRASDIRHDGEGLFLGLPSPCAVGRYHSLMIDASSLPPTFVATAWAGETLMGLRDADGLVEGVQFHPESVLTPLGTRMIGNFLAGTPRAPGPDRAR